MARLSQRTFVQCPYELGLASLLPAVQAEMNGSGVLHLRVPIKLGSLDVDLEKDVDVKLASPDPGKAGTPISLHWSPSGGGPYPEFDGTISLHRDDDANVSVLELGGTYAPPLGLAGAGFDAVLGSRIASATARELLHRVGRFLNHAYIMKKAEDL